MAEATFGLGADDSFDSIEGECQGCDQFLPVNDLGLCDECAAKLDRDLLRQRDWDYSTGAFGVDCVKREELRRQVVAQYGEGLELIAPSKEKKKPRARKRKKVNAKRN